MDPISTIQPQAPVAPKYPLLPVFLTLLFLLSSLYLAYQNMQLQKQITLLQNAPSPPISIIPPTPTTNPTTDWNIYTDNILKFSFKYPQLVTVDTINRDDGRGREYILSSGQTITVLSKYSSGETNILMNTNSTGEIQIGQVLWKSFYVPKGYPEPAVGAGKPIFALQAELSKYLIIVTLNNQSNITNEQKDILSTFKFLDQTAPTPTCTPLPGCAYSQDPGGVVCKIGEKTATGGSWCTRPTERLNN